MKIPMPQNHPHDDIEQLYALHNREITALAYSIVFDWEAAHGIMQESFTRLLKAGENGTKISHPRAWLNRATINLAMDYNKSAFRRNGTSNPQEMWCIKSHDPSPLESASCSEEHDVLAAALASLPNLVRTLIWMKFGRDMTYEEISDETNIPRGTIWKKIARALVLLRQRLDHLRDADIDRIPPAS